MSQPPGMKGTDPGPLVGSDRDLDEVVLELRRGRSAMVVGPPGSGKSHLLQALATELRDQGVEPLELRAASTLAHTPYGCLAATDRARILDAGTDSPAVALVDDAHHLDRETLQDLLLGMANRSMHVLFAVTTQRDGQPSGRHRAITRDLTSLWLEDRVTRFDLRPLAPEEARHLINFLPGGPELDEATRTAVVLWCCGSRLLLRELVSEASSLQRSGEEPLTGLVDLRRTPRLTSAIGVQIDDLTPAGRIALAVLERMRGVHYADACRVIGVDLVESLLEQQLITSHGTFPRRLYAHRPAARLAERSLPPDELAAALDRVDRHVLEIAAQEIPCDALCGFVAARRSVTFATDDPWRGLDSVAVSQLAARAARDANRSGRSELALACTQLTGVLPDVPEVVIERAAALHDMGELDEAYETIAGGDPAGLGPAESQRFVALMTTLCRNPDAGTLLDEVVNLVSPAARGAARALVDLAGAERALLGTDWTGALALARRALEGTDQGHIRLRAATMVACACLALSQRTEAEVALRHTLPADGVETSVGLSTELRARAVAVLVDAEPPTTGRRACEMTRCTQTAVVRLNPTDIALANLSWALLHLRQGDEDAAVRELDAAHRRVASTPASPWRSLLAGAAAITLARMGRASSARQALALCAIDDLRPRVLLECLRLIAEADIAASAGEVAVAATAARSAVSLVVGDAAFLHSLVDRHLRQTDRSTTRVPTQHGRRRALLTERETEIALLAAEGLTNRQIADRLYLSVRTVESHIYLACQKLGTVSRKELGREVATSWVSATIPPSDWS